MIVLTRFSVMMPDTVTISPDVGDNLSVIHEGYYRYYCKYLVIYHALQPIPKILAILSAAL